MVESSHLILVPPKSVVLASAVSGRLAAMLFLFPCFSIDNEKDCRIRLVGDATIILGHGCRAQSLRATIERYVTFNCMEKTAARNILLTEQES